MQASKESMNDHTDISTADGGHQVLVSVIENLISVDRNTAGARPRQSLGQLSDESLRNLAQDEGNAGTNETTGSQTEGNGSWDKPKGIDATQVVRAWLRPDNSGFTWIQYSGCALSLHMSLLSASAAIRTMGRLLENPERRREAGVPGRVCR